MEKDKFVLFLFVASSYALPKSESLPDSVPETEAEAESKGQWQDLNQAIGSLANSVGSNYNPGGGNSGFNPGGGSSGFNPGWNDDGSGFNPGGNGGSGYNPGGNGGSGFNPGGNGGSGYNPGGNGGSGFNPGGNGGSGYNPGWGNYLPVQDTSGGFITPVYGGNTGGGFNPGDVSGGTGFNPGSLVQPAPLPYPGGQGFNPGTGGACASDQCCGMADNNCCLGGQQCYTYYEQECTRVDRPRCQIESSEFCKTRQIPMCRVIRVPQSATIPAEHCVKRPKRECFKYQREICNTFPESYMHKVSWQNDRLEETDKEKIKECKEVDTCKIVPETKTVDKIVNKQVCNETKTEQKEQCTVDYEQSPSQVVQQTQYKVDYQQRCFNVPRQICESNSCTIQGCVNGGAVCSANDYTYQQRCATLVGGPAQQNLCGPQGNQVAGPVCGTGGNGNVCQEVKEAACYGPASSCQAPSQQCCRIVQQKVCQQVPVRVPMMVNMTIPGRMIPKRKCSMVEVETPVCKNVQETVQEEKTVDRCETEKKKQCVNFELPTFSIVKNNKSEEVDLRVRKCKKSVVEQEYCHTFPDAEVDCRERQETRRYILNKVVCDRQRDAKICRTIPWSRCMSGNGQECRMVPRQRCVDSCSSNPACGRCDQLRQTGQLETGCPTGPGAGPMIPSPLPAPGTLPISSAGSSCKNFYPKDLVGAFSPNLSNTVPGGHQGFQTLPNTIYQNPTPVSQNFIPSNTLPGDLGQHGSLPEIGNRSV